LPMVSEMLLKNYVQIMNLLWAKSYKTQWKALWFIIVKQVKSGEQSVSK
jgi:hypothetical protein